MVELPSNIIELQDEDEYVNLLVYADSGVGKTVFGGSDDDVLFVAPEDNGTISAKRLGSTAKKWQIHNWSDIQAAYKWLASLETIPFNWVVLDSLTEMQQMCMRHILDEGVRINPSRDPDVPQLQDWIPYFEKVRKMIKAFCALEVNCLFTALQQDEEDEDGNKVVLPMMQGKGTQYAKQAASMMTSFGQMRIAKMRDGQNDDGTDKWKEVRVITWKNTKTVMAKDRTLCLEPQTINKSLKQIRELLETGPKPAPEPRSVPEKPEPQQPLRTNESVDLLTVGVGADGEDEA
jgi:hypothetical protein